MTRGDHIYVRRFGYTHHGIDVGDGRTIHYSGEPGKSKAHASICYASREEFAQGGDVFVTKYGQRFSPEETAARAESKLGEGDYDLFGRNCEHFASWCSSDRHTSEQVNRAVAVGGLSTATAVAAATGVGVLSATATGLGLSGGAGVMAGLATAGGVVGGGAVAGLAVLGAAPGAAGVVIMRAALPDDESLSEEEREARSIGRGAAVAGAVAGSAGGIAAVSALGTAGLSAAGISSGLAGIGAVVGGGMVAGSAAVIAAPVAAAAAVGYGLYQAARWWRSS